MREHMCVCEEGISICNYNSARAHVRVHERVRVHVPVLVPIHVRACVHGISDQPRDQQFHRSRGARSPVMNLAQRSCITGAQARPDQPGVPAAVMQSLFGPLVVLL